MGEAQSSPFGLGALLILGTVDRIGAVVRLETLVGLCAEATLGTLARMGELVRLEALA